MNLSNDLQIPTAQKEAKALFEDVSMKIQIQCNNVFTFAKAFPLQKLAGMTTQRQVIDCREQLISALHKSQKQIDLKFEVLTQKFLKKIKDHGSKILHLTPCMASPDTEDSSAKVMVIEDETLCSVELTP